MALEERFYSCDIVKVTQKIGPNEVEINVPFITQEPTLHKGFSTRDIGDGDPVFIVAATPENWAIFDSNYPNQDAQTGDPYRRRYPRTKLPTIQFLE